ncbi:MAG: hypothetical protein V3U83_07360 [Acidobacteriota bacterium]
MRLITAHRILIGTAVAFFAFYAFWEFRGVGEIGSAWRGVAALIASTALLIYLLKLRTRNVPPGDGGGGGGP